VCVLTYVDQFLMHVFVARPFEVFMLPLSY